METAVDDYMIEIIKLGIIVRDGGEIEDAHIFGTIEKREVFKKYLRECIKNGNGINPMDLRGVMSTLQYERDLVVAAQGNKHIADLVAVVFW